MRLSSPPDFVLSAVALTPGSIPEEISRFRLVTAWKSSKLEPPLCHCKSTGVSLSEQELDSFEVVYVLSHQATPLTKVTKASTLFGSILPCVKSALPVLVRSG